MLTSSNYHSPEMNREYMSVSQYKAFRKCEARQIAILNNEFVEEKSDALLIGSALHAWSEGILPEFRLRHPEMYKKDGSLYAKFEVIDRMVKALENDEFAMFCLQGKKEVILEVEMFGVLWKGQIDVLNLEANRFVDLKTTKSIRELTWNDTTKIKETFLERFQYPTQFAAYAEMIKRKYELDKWPEGIMLAVSKEEICDKELISLKDDERTLYELTMIEQNLPRVIAVKSGKEKATKCGSCDYCISRKKLSRIIHFSELA